MTRMELSSVEIGMIHYVDSMADWEEVCRGPVMRYAQQLKADGVIGHIGLSSHNPAVAHKAVESGLIEVLMFSVNPCYDLQPASEDLELLWAEQSYEKPLVNMDPEREALYEACQRMGVGITVMKAFGGGDLLDETLSPAGRALTPYQCMSYALTRPAVAWVMAGARTLDELRECLSYSDASSRAARLRRRTRFVSQNKLAGALHVLRTLRALPQGDRYCIRYKIFKSLQGTGRHTGDSARTLCGAAAARIGLCRMRRLRKTLSVVGVPVIENMKSAAELFGK